MVISPPNFVLTSYSSFPEFTNTATDFDPAPKTARWTFLSADKNRCSVICIFDVNSFNGFKTSQVFLINLSVGWSPSAHPLSAFTNTPGVIACRLTGSTTRALSTDFIIPAIYLDSPSSFPMSRILVPCSGLYNPIRISSGGWTAAGILILNGPVLLIPGFHWDIGFSGLWSFCKRIFPFLSVKWTNIV